MCVCVVNASLSFEKRELMTGFEKLKIHATVTVILTYLLPNGVMAEETADFSHRHGPAINVVRCTVHFLSRLEFHIQLTCGDKDRRNSAACECPTKRRRNRSTICNSIRNITISVDLIIIIKVKKPSMDANRLFHRNYREMARTNRSVSRISPMTVT